MLALWQKVESGNEDTDYWNRSDGACGRQSDCKAVAGTRGISCGSNLEVNESDTSTSITVRANGGVYTNPLDETDTSKCMGIRVEGDMTVSAGTITVTATGKKAKTIKVVGRYTKTGTAVVNAANMDI